MLKRIFANLWSTGTASRRNFRPLLRRLVPSSFETLSMTINMFRFTLTLNTLSVDSTVLRESQLENLNCEFHFKFLDIVLPLNLTAMVSPGKGRFLVETFHRKSLENTIRVTRIYNVTRGPYRCLSSVCQPHSCGLIIKKKVKREQNALSRRVFFDHNE